MKKTLIYIFAIFLVVSLASSVQGFYTDAYFEDGTTTTSIDRGEDLNYYIDVFPNSYATSFNVNVRLFDETGPIVKNLGTLEDYKVNSADAYYSPLLPIKSSDYSLPGKYFLDIKITQTAKDGSTSISTETLKFSVPGERLIIADFIYSPSSPYVGEGVTLTSTSISEGHDIILEEWFIASTKIGEGTKITHVFDEPGTYSVTLKIKDDANRVAQVTKDITVKELEPENIAPTAQFTYNPTNPVVDEKVTFTSSSFDVDGIVVDEEWFIDDVLVHQGANITSFNHFFDESGSYDVRLDVTDDDGATDTITKTVVVEEQVVENIYPTARFDYNPSSPIEDDSVTFTSASFDTDGVVVKERWFIDNVLVGSFDYAQSSFDHVFTEARSYSVRLEVTDDDGATNTLTKDVIVGKYVPENIAPTAQFTYDPTNPLVDQTVTFTSSSFDVDGIIVKEEWFIDNVLVHSGVNDTSFNKVFDESGNYEVKLQVTDDDGATDVVTKIICVKEPVIENIAPTAQFTYEPSNPLVDESVTFTSSSFDVDGIIVKEEWFINGRLIYQSINESYFNKVFDEPRSYDVRLRVTDDDGATDMITKTVVVEKIIPENIAPTAQFTYEPSNPLVDESVTFTSSSFDVDGIIVDEQWFIDDQLVHEGLNDTSFNKVFDESGNYEVKLQVTDDDGATDFVTKIICVKEPVIENIAPTARFYYSPMNPIVQTPITFKSTSFDVDGVIVSEEWDFNNDGVYDAQGKTVEHTFDNTGVYIVRLLVEDDDGATDMAIKYVVVSKKPNVAPTADFTYNPQSPIVGDEISFGSTSFDTDGIIVDEQWFIDDQLVHEGVNETSFSTTALDIGSHEVKLLVEDDDGATDFVIKTIHVSEPISDVIAIIEGPQSPFVGEDVEYDGSDSYDTQGANIVLYDWTLTKDDVVVTSHSSTSAYFDHNFKSTGRYVLSLTVTNEFGESGSTTKNIYASRDYTSREDVSFGDTLTVDYHYVYGPEFGVIETNEYFTVYITVTNRGDETLRNLKTTFALPEFGIVEKSGFFTLRAGDSRTVEFHSIISDFDYIPLGDHDLLLGVSGEGITKYNYFPATII